MDNVVNEGEYSLFYFNGEYSHTILKTPQAGDFRVQEEHGGLITAFRPGAALQEAKGLCTSEVPLYARTNFVR
jgi:hypothetical protein